MTTSSPDAQAFYDQGLAFLHSYVWIEAARSFNQALRLDPALAMAHLGLSYAYSGLEDDQAARVVVERARSLASGASERERRRIEIRARQLEAIGEPGNLAKLEDYRKTIDEVLHPGFRHPADCDRGPRSDTGGGHRPRSQGLR